MIKVRARLLMKTLELALVLGAAAALTIWRGIAIYRQTFRRRNL